MAGTEPVTHVSVRGEHGIVIHIPVDDQETILATARADTQDEISDTTTDTEVLSKIRAKAHRGVRLWALGHGVPYAPDE